MLADDPVAVAAARLLGLDRPHWRCTDNDLAVEAEFRLRAAREYLADEASDQLRAFHAAQLESVRTEQERRLAVGPPHASRGMSRTDVERIRDAVPCHEYIQSLRLTDLRPAGRERWVGLCPFHMERSASLSVWRTHFVCFGCGVKGDVFEFVRLLLSMRREGLTGLALAGGDDATFRDAVRVLADYAGLPDPTVPPPRAGRDHDL